MTTKRNGDFLTDDEIEDLVEYFLDGYFESALGSTNDEDGHPLDDNYSQWNFDDEDREHAKAEAIKFLTTTGSEGRVADIIAKAAHKGTKKWTSERFAAAGGDFWLTRNGYGAGFWDGDWGDYDGELLTKASKAMGPADILVADDGDLEWYPHGARAPAPTGPSDADVDTINTYRRTMGMGKLDQATAGYSNEELAEMAANIRKHGRTVANPAKLKARLMR